jgi:hypothetical protein
MLQIDPLIHTISHWIECLDQYPTQQLITRPTPDAWSIGQLYLHLISDSRFYIEQAYFAFKTDEHATVETLPTTKELLEKNEFPDIKITGNPANALIPQPRDKQELVDGLVQLQRDIIDLNTFVTEKKSIGKSEHPGLGYLTPREWLQLMDMHYRHHLRQKKRIDLFLLQDIN